MKKALFATLLTAALLTACEGDQTPTEWNGIPERTNVSCQWDSANKIGACIGGGKAYTCVRVKVRVPDTTSKPKSWHVLIECARVSAPVLPEEPKSDE